MPKCGQKPVLGLIVVLVFPGLLLVFLGLLHVFLGLQHVSIMWLQGLQQMGRFDRLTLHLCRIIAVASHTWF